MAFFGATIPANGNFTLKPEADVLHLSHACLTKESKGKTYLKVKAQGKEFKVACLSSAGASHTTLDLFFNVAIDDKPIQFSCEGAGAVDVTGYWEHVGDDEDMDMPEMEGIFFQTVFL